MASNAHADFAKELVKSRRITKDQYDEAVTLAMRSGIPIHQAIAQLGFMEEIELLKALANFYQMRFFDLETTEIPRSLIERMPESMARENQVIPVAMEGDRTLIATSNPGDTEIAVKMQFVLGADVEMVLASREAIVQAINTQYGQSETQSVDSIMIEFTDTQIEATAVEGTQLEADEETAPIVRLCNLIIAEASAMRASDIHIEPFEDRVRVRYRIDGVLVERDSPPRRLLSALMTRLKIMSGIDITEKRRPQDGRIKTQANGKDLDIRVSILPTNHGQSAVMRLLDKDNIKIGVRDLGFAEEDYKKFAKLIRRPNGIFLVTGPTGSGKTTTLYAALNELNRPDRKIITAEDPVEYYLTGINQCEVKSDIGMTFQAIIRAMLRQAPNIILVGEIRDKETADIAIQASLTGHLVFSTLHTNDAPGSITRLIDVGVQPFLVASSLLACMAQRLVRRVCPKCKHPDKPEPEELTAVGLDPAILSGANFHRGKGCNYCNHTGHRGRMAIFELMVMNNALREMTFRGEPHMTLRKQARRDGMTTLLEDGLQKAIKGHTTIEEVVETAGLEDLQ